VLMTSVLMVAEVFEILQRICEIFEILSENFALKVCLESKEKGRDSPSCRLFFHPFFNLPAHSSGMSSNLRVGVSHCCCC
jgi:hypothetical protein